MAKKELTVNDKLRLLYELQQIDSQLDEIKILKGELPIEVSDLEDELAGLNTRVAKLENNIAEIQEEVKNHQTQIKESEALIVRYEKQLDSVKNNRECDALNKEVALQKLEIQLSEKKIKEIKVQEKEKNDILVITKERLSAKEVDLENKKVELKEIISRTEKDEEKIKAQSEKQAKKIEERLLKAYNKIRASYRNGLAVVPVERNACGGCFNHIPPQTQLEIGLSKKIIACEHCGRILIDKSVVTEEVLEEQD